MHIAAGLGFYWTTPTSAQIGLDPRIAVKLQNLNQNELRLIDCLTSPHNASEFQAQARRQGVPISRAQEIIAVLSEEQILDDGEESSADVDIRRRIGSLPPHNRREIIIEFSRCDALGIGIASELAMAGITRIQTADLARIGSYDHPLASAYYRNSERRSALQSHLRAIAASQPDNSSLSNQHSQSTQHTHQHTHQSTHKPHLAVVTGFHAADPFVASRYLARGIPVLQAWIEEVDICIGNLMLPQSSPCPGCTFLHRIDSTPGWETLAPQALAGRPLHPESSSLSLAISIASRALLNWIDFGRTTLTTHQWIIRPAPQLPERIPITPHPQCNCTELSG